MKKKKGTLAIFTLVVHKEKDGHYFGYAPYIREMNIWTNHFEKVIVVGPFSSSKSIDKIDLSYSHSDLSLVEVPVFNIKSLGSIGRLLLDLPSMIFRMYRVMKNSDYFHFRCPSNVSAVAAIVQVLFPKTPKSTKYAGNWDPNSKQPIGYRFQKWLLANRTLTKNMKVLVYGEWKNQSRSVIPFMPATYRDYEKISFKSRDFSNKLKFVFIGAMVIGKRPMLTVQVLELLIEKGFNVELHMFGDGDLIEEIKEYIKNNGLLDHIKVYGNRDKNAIKHCLLDTHFSILPSKSEGWPKAIAEGMFFGAIPISTEISCLPWILDYGKRGILISDNLEAATATIIDELNKGQNYLNEMSKKAQDWAQQYTLDRLEQEIEKIIKE